MSDIYVKAEKLSKHFLVFKRKETALRALKALITREPLKKEYWVLRDIAFEIKKGEKLAIIGRNGSGKTTLLRIIAGIYDKSHGEIEVNCNPSILFKFWIGLNGDLPVIDNIYLFGAVHGMSRDYLKSRISKIIQMAELGELQFSPLKGLSVGQMQRLAVSVFFQIPNDFLIFDESLTFMDQGFVQKCYEYFEGLHSSGKTVIITSHDNSFLKQYCNTAIWLDEGRIRMFSDARSVIGEYERSFNTTP